jgi:hypothetical protein
VTILLNSWPLVLGVSRPLVLYPSWPRSPDVEGLRTKHSNFLAASGARQVPSTANGGAHDRHAGVWHVRSQEDKEHETKETGETPEAGRVTKEPFGHANGWWGSADYSIWSCGAGRLGTRSHTRGGRGVRRARERRRRRWERV